MAHLDCGAVVDQVRHVLGDLEVHVVHPRHAPKHGVGGGGLVQGLFTVHKVAHLKQQQQEEEQQPGRQVSRGGAREGGRGGSPR